VAAAPAPPRRIASLNLAAEEVLVEILPPGRLAAVTALADERGTSNIVGRIPAAVPRLPRADVERLVALRPDLVVVSEYTDADFLHQLETTGLRTHRMRGLTSFAGYRAAIVELGRVVGEDAAARALLVRYDALLDELRRRLAPVERPRVLYWASSLTAGSDTAIGALIEAAGGRNVGRELGLSGIAAIGAERAFVADPDIVLVGTGWDSAATLRAHPLLARLRAVRQGRVIELPTELLVALSQHAADAAWRLGHALHPDAVPLAPPPLP
jgi:iron complex transport system substrate-binding protein